MKQNILITGFLMAFNVAFAQVGINTETPDPSSVLDIHSDTKGVLLPRVTLTSDTQVLAETNNAVGLLVYHVGTPSLRQGFYSWNGTKWVSFIDQSQLDEDSGAGVPSAQKFFYMPSIVIDTSVPAVGKKRNLYLEYVAQFTNKEFILNNDGGSIGTNASTTFVKSANAPNTIPVIPVAKDIYYYVTNYDTTALENLSIDEDGILTYDVKAAGTDYSFLNIVFVVK